MNRNTVRIPLGLAYLAVLMISATLIHGCVSGGGKLSPTQEWEVASLSYAEAVSIATDLALAGRMTADDADRFEDRRIMARIYLDDWYEANAAGTTFDHAIELNRYLIDMAAIGAAIEHEHP